MSATTAYILFEVAETTYAVDTSVVQQMEMVERITRAPNSPSFVDGVVYLRGQVIPVINLRSRFGLERIPYDLRARLIIVNVGGRVGGLAADTAREYRSIADDQVLPPPDLLGEGAGSFVRGMVSLDDRLVMVLDVAKVLSNREKAQLSFSDETSL